MPANPPPPEVTLPDTLPIPGRAPIDWDLVATLLAQGMATTAIARHLGCSRVTVWRQVRKRERMRRLIVEEHAAQRLEVAGRLDGLRSLVAGQIEQQVRDGNVRVLLWLADRMNLTAQDLPASLIATVATPSVFETAEEQPVAVAQNEVAPLQAPPEASVSNASTRGEVAPRFIPLPPMLPPMLPGAAAFHHAPTAGTA